MVGFLPIQTPGPLLSSEVPTRAILPTPMAVASSHTLMAMSSLGCLSGLQPLSSTVHRPAPQTHTFKIEPTTHPQASSLPEDPRNVRVTCDFLSFSLTHLSTSDPFPGLLSLMFHVLKVSCPRTLIFISTVTVQPQLLSHLFWLLQEPVFILCTASKNSLNDSNLFLSTFCLESFNSLSVKKNENQSP